MKIKIQYLLTILLSITASAFICELVQATDWRSPGAQRDAVLGNSRTGNGNNRSSGPSTTGSAAQQREDAERAEQNRRYDAIYQQAGEAWAKQDWREALRLYKQQQTMRDGPNVRENIVKVKAFIAWSEATTAADYRRAIAMRPGSFTHEHIRYVEEIEAKEKREAENLKVATRMRKKIDEFASSLDTAPPRAGVVVTQGRILEDDLGTHKAEGRLEFGDPNAPEALGEQARQGFDKTGPLKGSRPVTSDTVPGVPTSAGHPDISAVAAKYRNDAEVMRCDKEGRDAANQMKKFKEDLVKLEKDKQDIPNEKQQAVEKAELNNKISNTQSQIDAAEIKKKRAMRRFDATHVN